MTILDLLNNVKEDIAKDNIKHAISKLKIIFEDSPLLYEIILHESRHISLKKDIRKGVINFENSKNEANKIKIALLEIVQEINLLNKNELLVADELSSLDLNKIKNSPTHFGKGDIVERDKVTHINKQNNFFEKSVKVNPIIGILSLIAVFLIIGILIQLIFVRNAQLDEQILIINRQNQSIEVSKSLTTTEFTQAYSRLRECYKQNKVDNQKQFTDDLNFVMGRFDDIALYVQSGQVDDCLVKVGTFNTIINFTPVLEYCNYPTPNRQKFDLLSNHFSTLTKCD